MGEEVNRGESLVVRGEVLCDRGIVREANDEFTNGAGRESE